ncbi:unnamed protein product [Candidula unifasciata]|uniref:BHLH domain-containing protein n=1 Tax=Candidula unifasciata TaxID=100452 RepID=A0A8S3ZYH9_9EUPU|nr:unnamed protein product [Candidula unifasciata]
MDMLGHALDSSEDKSDDSADAGDMHLSHTVDTDLDHTDEQAAAFAGVQQHQGTITIDPSLQYQIRADNSAGQVTYRVVQVAHDGSEAAAQVMGGTAFAGQQTVIQNPFNNGGSPTGQFYVMMSPQDVLQGQRQIAPRTSYSPKLEGGRSTRDDRRRATHNEVERRRRDKINNWIVQLSKLVPDCANEPVKQTQASKGGILSKACEYIQELRAANLRLADSLKDAERLHIDNDLLRQQCEEYKQENAILRSHLQQHGVILDNGSGTS